MEVITESEESALKKLATNLGASEAALRLLISIFVGFPVVLFHRFYLYGKNVQLQHILFLTAGLSINYFNYGQDILHTVATVLVVYAVLHIFHGTIHGPIITLSFTMTYLLTGYYMTGTDTYDIKWTMPQCVLTLRLSGLAFDLYDGCQKLESLSSENKKVALKQVPSFIEILAYAFFPSSFLVGPQFPMKRYQDFVNGSFSPAKGVLPDCLIPALKRTLLGVTYLAVYQVGYMYFNDDYLLSKSYEDLSFWKRCIVLGIWGHLALYKYISCWLMVEGVCIASGITYNGKDDNGTPKWDGLSNVDLKVFEGATWFNHYIESFNVNTNHWVAQYVYKRLKFLGNKQLSQLGVLIFLAVWHGLHSGYYVTFFLEFICQVMEKDLYGILEKNGTALQFLQKPGIKQLKFIILKFYTIIFMGYCMAPFVLLSYDRWWQVHKSVFFIGHILWMPWLLYKPVVKALLPSKKPHAS